MEINRQKITNNDVDIVFAKVKVKGSKTIAFGDFENALSEIAKKKEKPKKMLLVLFKNMEQQLIREPKLIMSHSMIIKISILVYMLGLEQLL